MTSRELRAQAEFGTDIWYYGASPVLPCFSPVGEPWRDDVSVEMQHQVRDRCNYWERTIHTPEGDLHDVKRGLIIAEGSGSGPEIVGPLVKDLGRDLPLLRYMQADPERMVEDRLQVYKPRGGYIMDGSNSLVYEMPAENVRALAQAGLEFGKY